MAPETTSRREIHTGTHQEILALACETLKPFQASSFGTSLLERGGTAIPKPHSNEPAEHSFLSQTGLNLVKEASLEMVHSLGRDSEVVIGDRTIKLSNYASLVEPKLFVPGGTRIDPASEVATGLYAKLFMQAIERPDLIPALDAMVQVAGVDGMNTAADRVHSLFDLVEECVVDDMYPRFIYEALTQIDISEQKNKLPFSVQARRAALSDNGFNAYLYELINSRNPAEQEDGRNTLGLLVAALAGSFMQPNEFKRFHSSGEAGFLVHCLGRETARFTIRHAATALSQKIIGKDRALLDGQLSVSYIAAFPHSTQVVAVMNALHREAARSVQAGDSIQMLQSTILQLLEHYLIHGYSPQENNVLNRAGKLCLGYSA